MCKMPWWAGAKTQPYHFHDPKMQAHYNSGKTVGYATAMIDFKASFDHAEDCACQWCRVIHGEV